MNSENNDAVKSPANPLEYALNNVRQFKQRNTETKVFGTEFLDAAELQIEKEIKNSSRLMNLLDRAFEEVIAPLGAGVEIKPSMEIEDLAMEIFHELQRGEICRQK